MSCILESCFSLCTLCNYFPWPFVPITCRMWPCAAIWRKNPRSQPASMDSNELQYWYQACPIITVLFGKASKLQVQMSASPRGPCVMHATRVSATNMYWLPLKCYRDSSSWRCNGEWERMLQEGLLETEGLVETDGSRIVEISHTHVCWAAWAFKAFYLTMAWGYSGPPSPVKQWPILMGR